MILMGLLGLVIGGLIGATALGGDTKTETLPGEVVTNNKTVTRTVGRGGQKSGGRTVTRVRTVTAPAPSPAPGEVPAGQPVRSVKGTRVFTGKGFKRLGTLKVAKRSVMEWTNTGTVFSVISQTVLHVSSKEKKGSARLFEGTYPDFRVGAIGRWTLKIRPR